MAEVVIRKNRFPQIVNVLKEQMPLIVGKLVADGQTVAQHHSRVDTGTMRAAWATTVSQHGGPSASVEGLLYNNVEYVLYNEYGTRFMSAQPMAAPAFESMRLTIVSLLRQMGGQVQGA